MGRLIDLDDVLAIQMSKRAKEKVMALNSKPAIIYDCDMPWSKDLDKCECHTLACIMLMAFRYGVNRHYTQSLFRPDEHSVIEQNLDLMYDDFIKQMIDGIHQEYRMWNWQQAQDESNSSYRMANPHYLQPMLDKLQAEYKKRTGKEIAHEE